MYITYLFYFDSSANNIIKYNNRYVRKLDGNIVFTLLFTFGRIWSSTYTRLA